MRILITNNTLDVRAGSELYVRDLAIALIGRGHHPIAYSQSLGEVADELRAATVSVVDDLNKVSEAPHLIHGQHHLETMTALLHFQGVPAVFFCHGWMPWQEAPPLHPRIVRYVAVDDVCRQRLVDEGGVPPDMTEVLLNFVDLERFRPRPSLPKVLQKALFYSNNGGTDGGVAALRRVCSERGMELDIVGQASGNPTASPEFLLPEYDLVFARGRAALEAMAVGCAVILCDAKRVGPLVDSSNFDTLRPLNFGLRALRSPVSAKSLGAQLDCFDRDDAASVSARVRREAGLSDVVDRLLVLYQESVKTVESSAAAEGRATADYLRGLAPRIKENEQLQLQLTNAVDAALHWQQGAESIAGANDWLEQEKRRAEQIAAALEEENARLRGELDGG